MLQRSNTIDQNYNLTETKELNPFDLQGLNGGNRDKEKKPSLLRPQSIKEDTTKRVQFGDLAR